LIVAGARSSSVVAENVQVDGADVPLRQIHSSISELPENMIGPVDAEAVGKAQRGGTREELA